MKKGLIISCLALGLCLFAACKPGDTTSAQSRTDLTADHISILDADMERSDVEALIGKDDASLSAKEDLDVYSLSDGKVAILRYANDKLQSVSIRDNDNYEDVVFSNYHKNTITGSEANDSTGGNYDSNNGAVDTNTRR